MQEERKKVKKWMACPGIGENIWKSWKEEKISCIYNKRKSYTLAPESMIQELGMSAPTGNQSDTKTSERVSPFNNIPRKTGCTLMFVMRVWGENWRWEGDEECREAKQHFQTLAGEGEERHQGAATRGYALDKRETLNILTVEQKARIGANASQI